MPFDPKEFRLRQDFDNMGDVKEVLTTIEVRKPTKTEFVRVHPDSEMRLGPVGLLEVGEAHEQFLVAPARFDEVALVAKLKEIRLAVNADRVPFLWMLPAPDSGVRPNPWNESLRAAADRAEAEWVRVMSDTKLGAYRVYVAVGNLGDPVFPTVSFGELVELGFRDRVIESADHPVLRRLRGDV